MDGKNRKTYDGVMSGSKKNNNNTKFSRSGATKIVTGSPVDVDESIVISRQDNSHRKISKDMPLKWWKSHR